MGGALLTVVLVLPLLASSTFGQLSKPIFEDGHVDVANNKFLQRQANNKGAAR